LCALDGKLASHVAQTAQVYSQIGLTLDKSLATKEKYRRSPSRLLNWVRRLGELAEDWAFFLHRDGWKFPTLCSIAREMAQLPYRHIRFVVVARSLWASLPDVEPKMTLDIRPFGSQDLQSVIIINRPSESRACALRLARGHTGLAAFYQDQLVGYAWGCPEVAPTLERVPLNLAPGDFLCQDDFTDPIYRKNGVHVALTLARFRVFRRNGFRRAVAFIESQNKASLSSYLKVGSRVIGHIEFYRVGPWRWSRYTPIP